MAKLVGICVGFMRGICAGSIRGRQDGHMRGICVGHKCVGRMGDPGWPHEGDMMYSYGRDTLYCTVNGRQFEGDMGWLKGVYCTGKLLLHRHIFSLQNVFY
jgi:hypothetical protein